MNPDEQNPVTNPEPPTYSQPTPQAPPQSYNPNSQPSSPYQGPYPQAPQQPASPHYDPNYNPKERVSNELSVMQPGEVTICEIKRHPVGIITVYVGVGFMLVLAAALIFGVGPHVVSDSSQLDKIGGVILLLLGTVGLLYAMIATSIYWSNKWVVTSDSITQVQRNGLFDRQSAQLALANIEDVTSEQNGPLAHLFNYGVLKAETAGHRSKFVFPYTPNPNFYAQRILAAREALGSGAGEGGASVNTNPGAPSNLEYR